jgi:hypothetical protein
MLKGAYKFPFVEVTWFAARQLSFYFSSMLFKFFFATKRIGVIGVLSFVNITILWLSFTLLVVPLFRHFSLSNKFPVEGCLTNNFFYDGCLEIFARVSLIVTSFLELNFLKVTTFYLFLTSLLLSPSLFTPI